MGNINSHVRPRAGTAADLAGQHIYKHGPATARELFIAANFGRKLSEKAGALERAVSTGWLVAQADGKYQISLSARAHYDELAANEVFTPTAKIAAPRTVNVFASPGLSKRFIPNSRGTRQDIPAWSVRAAGTSFHKV